MTFFLIVGGFCLALTVICLLTDRPADDDTDDFTQPRHVRVLDRTDAP